MADKSVPVGKSAGNGAIQVSDSKTISAPLYANPAAVGLGAFGATTLLLQFYNFGWIQSGVVMWLAFFFGGLAQVVAGFQEFNTGNNFGFAAFTTYGSFWIALGGIFLSLNTGFIKITNGDIGHFLVIFTILTFIYLLGALKQSAALSLVFFTLLIGYILLDIFFLGGTHAWLTAAAVDLTICALSALYLMAHVVLTPLRINISAGAPIWK
jgi:succinate-acetate transporter protein